MIKYLIPRIARKDVLPIVGVAFAGAIVAGAYGVAHNQITYGISAEYFTKVKFNQFWYADPGLGDRTFVSAVGFIAASSVGFIIGWLLARRYIPNQPRPQVYRRVLAASAIVFLCAVFSGCLGYAYGLWRGPDADYSLWAPLFEQYQITGAWSFVRAAYIHNASYFGGLVGAIMAIFAIRTCRETVREPRT